MKHTIMNSKPANAPKKGFWAWLYNFINPPLSIIEFDNAESFCGAEIFVHTMYFAEGTREYPCNVTGYVKYNDVWLDCTWNAQGKCHCPLLDKDSYIFDLLRPNKLKSVSNSRTDSELRTIATNQ